MTKFKSTETNSTLMGYISQMDNRLSERTKQEYTAQLATRKAGHIEDYIERTIKVAEQLELSKRYPEKTKDKDRDHGMSL